LIGLGLFLVLGVALVARVLYALRARHPGYVLDLNVEGPGAGRAPRPLQAGFGRVKINPDLSDPRHPIWLAGFAQHRAATALHDDLWAVACVIDDGYARLGVIPKSEWDRKPPWLYGAKHSPYGEVNSVGPEAGPAIHGALRALTSAVP
jgi:hypothetical protein